MRHYLFLFFFLFLFLNTDTFGQKKFLVIGQSNEYQLYTNIDTTDLSKFKGVFNFMNFSKDRLLKYRDFIRPYAYANDPFGEYLYAATFDLYPFGFGDPQSADTTLLYCKRAADKNLAIAEEFLFQTYKNGFMTVKKDSKTALEYLKRFLLHGDSSLKAEGYREMALLYYKGDFEEIKIDTLKTMENLELSLRYDSTDTWTIDFLGGIYEYKGNYEKAAELLLKSGNAQSHLEVAEWMLEGKRVKKDFEKGLAIIFREAEELMQSGINIREYMASRNPVYMLNDLYQSKKITKKQLGKFYLENYFRDE